MKETRQVEVEGRMEFDHRVEIRDPKTGKITTYQPYILHVNRDGSLYESPPKSGKFFDAQGVLVKDISEELKAKFPERYAQAAPAEDMAKLKAENEKLKAELAAKTPAEPEQKESDDPVASAEKEAEAILAGARTTQRSAVRTRTAQEN